MMPESGGAPNPELKYITNPYAVVPDSTIGKNKGTLFNSSQFPADMASEMACVVPVNSAGRLTQLPTFSADMTADMACGESPTFSADTAAGMAHEEQISSNAACRAHVDLATRLGKPTPGLASHLDTAHSAREGQKQPILDSAPRVHWETGQLATDTANEMLRMPTRINLH